ncbi:glycoside hydrolase family 26 protein [uncultured Bacteroides sp.]|uniref:glycoside hydrolase family 26 protein n=1 Tax=uncultured Bacteroides sp. TaxID=162156 RepID=UPI0025CCE88A|nr:glycosyl hydrolase [uncultured Bacteroides sp.]
MNFKTSIAIFMTACTVSLSAQTRQPADPEATPEARQLLTRLINIQSKGIMYGHQDDLMTGHTWWYEPDRSDTKEAVGDYPAIAGFELGEIELGGPLSLDSISFANIAERVRWFHRQNGIITISWHCVNPITSQWPGIKEPNGAGSAWEVEMLSADQLNAVRSILPGGCNHAMFNSWLDRLVKNFKQWRDEKGALIPFIFRPYHEHSGSFFWWGTQRCYDEEYATLWRYTVNYLRNKGLHNILYAYNTDKVYSAEEFLKGYPGDEYIDMLSIDWYGQGEEFNKNVNYALDFISQIATQKQKLFALSECGPISADLQKILEKYQATYVLTWRNAPPRGGRRNYTPPTPEQLAQMPADMRAAYENRMKQPKHEDLLKIMKSNKRYLFLKDIQKIQ